MGNGAAARLSIKQSTLQFLRVHDAQRAAGGSRDAVDQLLHRTQIITVTKGETLEAFDVGAIDFQAGGFASLITITGGTGSHAGPRDNCGSPASSIRRRARLKATTAARSAPRNGCEHVDAQHNCWSVISANPSGFSANRWTARPLLRTVAEVRMPFPLDSDDLEQTPPQTEDAEERGFVRRRDDRNLGRTEELDEKDAGDIADEGPGHRG